MSAPASLDALVIGAGINGLVAAARLAVAGRRLLVVERADRVGGCVQSSGDVTVPGAIHDLWATNVGLWLGGAAHADLKAHLDRHGVAFARTDRPFATVLPGGTALRVTTDAARTRAGLRRHDPQDADGWARLAAVAADVQSAFLPLLGQTVPSARAVGTLTKALATLGPVRFAEATQAVLATTRELGQRYLHSPEAAALLAPWGLHLDYGPDVSGGGVFPIAEGFGAAQNGMSVVEGGAQRLVDALAAIVAEHGGEVRTGVEVARVIVEGGRALGVELATGERIGAEDVIANVTPRGLVGRLLAGVALDVDVRARADGFRYGPATMMMHLALDGPIPWAADTPGASGYDAHLPLSSFGYVHVTPGVDALAAAYADALAGRLPEHPLLVVGQTSAVDPTRVAACAPGTTTAWIQVRPLPAEITGDALGQIGARSWAEATDAFAARVLDRLEAAAPGVRARIVGQRVFGPHELEAHNPNLVGGDSIGGSHHLDQMPALRPFVGAATYRMPGVEHLWMVGAGTWPGAGTGGTSGFLVSEAMLSEGSRLLATLAAGGAAGVAAALKLRRRS